MIRNLEEFGLPQEEYGWYIDLRKYGTFPHTGFGIGVERLLAWMLNLESVRTLYLFPALYKERIPKLRKFKTKFSRITKLLLIQTASIGKDSKANPESYPWSLEKLSLSPLPS
ncbi:MAG: amino acid--tRNA ligase-related protein [Candidatus Bathyarchaeia archaeon]